MFNFLTPPPETRNIFYLQRTIGQKKENTIMIIVKRRKPADQWDQGEQIKKELNRVEQKYQQQKKKPKIFINLTDYNSKLNWGRVSVTLVIRLSLAAGRSTRHWQCLKRETRDKQCTWLSLLRQQGGNATTYILYMCMRTASVCCCQALTYSSK